MTPLLTPAEVAALLGVSRQLVSRWTVSGELQCVRLTPATPRYELAAVERFAESRRVDRTLRVIK